MRIKFVCWFSRRFWDIHDYPSESGWRRHSDSLVLLQVLALWEEVWNLTMADPKRRQRKVRQAELTTVGWEPAFRARIMEALAAADGNAVQVALDYNVNPQQVLNCVARTKHIAAHQYNSRSTIERLEALEGLAVSSLEYALLHTDDPYRRGELARKFIEGRHKAKKTSPDTLINVNIKGGKTQINSYAHASDEQLKVEARRLIDAVESGDEPDAPSGRDARVEGAGRQQE